MLAASLPAANSMLAELAHSLWLPGCAALHPSAQVLILYFYFQSEHDDKSTLDSYDQFLIALMCADAALLTVSGQHIRACLSLPRGRLKAHFRFC
jgi:hypothetical protein